MGDSRYETRAIVRTYKRGGQSPNKNLKHSWLTQQSERAAAWSEYDARENILIWKVAELFEW